MSSRPMTLLGIAVFLFALADGGESTGCTLFYSAHGDTVLGGNNEDWHVPLTKVWFVPEREDRYGVAYVTFDDHRAIQGGMNDQGLFFDFLAVKPREVKATPDKLRWNAHPLRKVMEQCATVGEAVEMLETHNRAFMRRICIFLGDAQGTSAIVEAEAVVRKQGPHQVATNFRQSLTPPREATCRRYHTAARMLSQADGPSVDLFRRICAAVHQEGNNSTLYSTVYDLKRKVIYLYHFHDFDNVVVFDLEKELAKGERVVEMPDLFPPKPAFEDFRQNSATQPHPQPAAGSRR
jgi:penicillin V acylase-like amidase (Ntn superfamily)